MKSAAWKALNESIYSDWVLVMWHEQQVKQFSVSGS